MPLPQTRSPSRFRLWAQNVLDKPVMLYSDIVPLIYVNETLYGGLPFFKIQVNYFMAQDKPFGAILNFKTFLSFINRLLVFSWMLYSH